MMAPVSPLAIRRVIDIASSQSGFSVIQIVGDSRRRDLVMVRFAIVWAAHAGLGASGRSLGQQLGGRDHTTMIHAMRRAEGLRISDPAFAAMTDRLLAAVEAPTDG